MVGNRSGKIKGSDPLTKKKKRLVIVGVIMVVVLSLGGLHYKKKKAELLADAIPDWKYKIPVPIVNFEKFGKDKKNVLLETRSLTKEESDRRWQGREVALNGVDNPVFSQNYVVRFESITRASSYMGSDSRVKKHDAIIYKVVGEKLQAYKTLDLKKIAGEWEHQAEPVGARGTYVRGSDEYLGVVIQKIADDKARIIFINIETEEILEGEDLPSSEAIFYTEDIQVEKLSGLYVFNSDISCALEIAKFKRVSLTNRKLAEKYPEIEKSLSKGNLTEILLYEQEDQENINELMEKK